MLSKYNVLGIARDHVTTLRDDQTGKPSISDFLVSYGVPTGVGALAAWQGMRLADATPVITVQALLAGFLLNMMFKTVDWAARQPDEPSPEDYRIDRAAAARRRSKNLLLAEVHGSLAYGFLVALAGVTLAVVVVVAGIPDEGVAVGWTSVTIAIMVHLGITLLMLLRRMYRLGQVETEGYYGRQPQ